MPLQNRVDPWGQFHAVTAHGALMGNRGILHDQQQQIVAPWRGKAWITCKLHVEGIRRTVFGAGTYSELFFMDEATAFAAGHRPCAQCRRDRFKEFKAAWISANRNSLLTPKPTIAEIDNVIHAERAAKGGVKITYEALIKYLPDGTLVDVGGVALLVWHGELLRWTFDGYRPEVPTLPLSTSVRVLTPASVVQVFESGFIPEVHASVNA
jgi:hypothetical protein